MLFTMGCVISLTALTIIGRFQVQDLLYSLFLIMGVIVGVLCSGPFKRLIDKQSVRPWLLGLCTLSAFMVLIRAMLSLF